MRVRVNQNGGIKEILRSGCGVLSHTNHSNYSTDNFYLHLIVDLEIKKSERNRNNNGRIRV